MDDAIARRHSAETLLRSVESLPFGPLWLTLGVSGAIIALFLGWCAIFGPIDGLFGAAYPLRVGAPARIALVIAVLTAFLLATRRYEIRKAAADWAPLQPLTRRSPAEFARLIEESRDRARSSRRGFDVFGALVGLAIVPASTSEPASLLRPEAWNPVVVWMSLANAVLFLMMARAARASLLGRELNDRIAAEITELDLLETQPLHCFARQGLRRAFYWVGGSSIASLLGLSLERTWPTFTIIALTLALATFALLDPVRAVRVRIRAAKRAELARVRDRIRDARHEMLARGERASEAAVALPGLLAYEARIAHVNEWPFDTSTLLRFGGLALLATGSWLGSALVERMLDVALE